MPPKGPNTDLRHHFMAEKEFFLESINSKAMVTDKLTKGITKEEQLQHCESMKLKH